MAGRDLTSTDDAAAPPAPALFAAHPQKTTAWPLAWLYVALVAYASLYPFSEWRDQGIAPWAYLAAPFPKYWTGFDFAINVAGYVPLGFLVALALRRNRPLGSRMSAALLATAAATLLSFAMESAQSYLPMRIPSNVDLALNALGGGVGAAIAASLEALGGFMLWQRLRGNWFVADARGALLLLMLWPVALLFPVAVPFGLGQVFERLESGLAELLVGSPFLDWLPVRQFELEPLVPAAQMLAVMLGALVPCLLIFSVSRSIARRALMWPATLGVGVFSTALSSGLSFGPTHAMAWFNAPTGTGLAAAAVASTVLMPLRRRLCAALLLMALVIHLGLINQAPESAYFAQTLATWEQGRFIRFHGLVQWLGWIWPFAALAFTLAVLARPDRTPAPAPATPTDGPAGIDERAGLDRHT